VRIKEFKKKEKPNDGISEMTLMLYRMAIDKKEQKEAALKIAYAKRKG
jgi:hypothetical protein